MVVCICFQPDFGHQKAVQAPDDIEKNPALWPGVWASVSLSVILGGMVSLIILATR